MTIFKRYVEVWRHDCFCSNNIYIAESLRTEWMWVILKNSSFNKELQCSYKCESLYKSFSQEFVGNCIQSTSLFLPQKSVDGIFTWGRITHMLHQLELFNCAFQEDYSCVYRSAYKRTKWKFNFPRSPRIGWSFSLCIHYSYNSTCK